MRPGRFRLRRPYSTTDSGVPCWRPPKDYASLRERHAQKNERSMLTLAKARANRTPIEWEGYAPPVPAQGLGVRDFHDYDLAELREYIDWQPFFNAWEMKGRFPTSSTTRPRARPPASSTTTPRRCSTP